MRGFEGGLGIVRWIVTGLILMLTASFATAAIVICLPDSPLAPGDGRMEEQGDALQIVRNSAAYVQLHRARNATVPERMRIAVRPDPR